jgi:hypothetical protein
MLLPHLVTFPRSGSHYFAKIIYEKTMFNIQRSHSINISFNNNNKKTKTIVTIARDPKDSITSLIALDKMQGFQMPDSKINEVITYYIMFYSFLYEHADYVIDFKDLLLFPNNVVEKTLDLLKIDEQSYLKFPDHIDYDTKGLAKKSSKSFSIYKNIDLDKFDMELCYFYYNKLLSKAIKFEKA